MFGYGSWYNVPGLVDAFDIVDRIGHAEESFGVGSGDIYLIDNVPCLQPKKSRNWCAILL